MRRPRDWGHPCPNAECPLFKRMNRGNVSAISTYMTESGKRRIFRCRHCETTFSETQDTVFFDLRTSEEKVMMALKMLLVRVDLSEISFVLGVHEETVLAWLVRTAAKAHEINAHLLRNLPVTQVQLDEMWNFIERKHAHETDEAGETLRQALAPLARKTSSFCKDRERLRQRVVFFQAFYNVARPHMSLRRPLPMRERTRHGAIRPRWRERTPAMAAGLTDHVWTFRELRTATFEPLDSQSISG